MQQSSQKRSRRQFLAAAGVVAVAGCMETSDPGRTEQSETDRTPTDNGEKRVNDDYEHPTPSDDPGWEAPEGKPSTDIEVTVLVENLDIPWDISVTGNESMYVTERTGSLLRLASGKLSEVVRPRDAIDAESIPPGSDEDAWLVNGGEGGTLGVAAHPSYPSEPFVYVYYTTDATGSKQNRVVRYDTSAADPASTEEIVVGAIPASTYHNGGRIAFGPDDNLWICTGDANEGGRARDSAYLGGKVLRVTPEGKPPASNPDLGGDPRVFTTGHRNPQGINWLPNGVPVITEHGPTNRDEVSFLVPGGDYGWNVARGGPDDERWESYASHDEFVPPVVNTGPRDSWAPSGTTFYTGDAIPTWQNRLVVSGLISQSLWIVTLTPPDGTLPPLGENGRRFDTDWLHPTVTATAHRVLHDELGRIRHVIQNHDGDLYAITSNRDGRGDGPFPRENDDVLVKLTAG